MTPIYLDHAASTRVHDDVVVLMTEVMRTAWGNPSAQHPQGAAARAYIATARQRLLAALGDAPRGGDAGRGDVVWTSGCTEADALAVLGAAQVRPGPIVVSAVEHPAVGAAAARLEDGRRAVVHLPVGRDGVIDPDAAARAAAGAGVVAVVMVQNEIGVVQPVASIIAAIRAVAPDAHLHVDAAQAFGKIPLDATTLGADSIALAAHKFGGPKGSGALWLRRGVVLAPLWVGGGQQHGLRGGTEDAPAAAGLGLAAERAVHASASARTRWLELAEIVRRTLDARGVAYRQLVPDQRRAPHILALGLAGVPATALRTVLASRGVYVSTGSACAAAKADGGKPEKPSAVLAALELPEDMGMCRLSFGHDTTADELERASAILADVALELRKA